MNSKLSFLIFLAASALLTPVEKAFGQTVPQMNVKEVQHLVCIKEVQHLRCTVETSKEHNQSQGAVQQAKATNSSKSSLVTVGSQSPNQQRLVDQKINQYSTTNAIVGLILLLFICGNGLGIFLYKKYRTNRVTVLHRNIEVLERLWKTSNIQ